MNSILITLHSGAPPFGMVLAPQGGCFSPQEVWARLQAKREIKEIKSEAEEEKPKDNPKLKYKGRVGKHKRDNIKHK